MDKNEALSVLGDFLAGYRGRSYGELTRLIGAEPVTAEVKGQSGSSYQIEVQAFWDSREGGNVRVTGSVDDGGWRAMLPLSADFIKAPDNAFVGE